MNKLERNKIILQRLQNKDNIKMIVGSGNINEDYDRFVKQKLYDVTLTDNINLIDYLQSIPALNIDFNSVFMRGLYSFLKEKFSLIQFDFSTSKFYNGTQTDTLLSLLKKDGVLIIDTHDYIKILDNYTLEKILTESESNNNNKFICVYSHNNEDLNLRIINNNKKHFESDETHVSLLKGDYR